MSILKKTTGSSSKKNQTNVFTYIIIAALILLYALLWVNLVTVIVLFVISIVGIVISLFFKKPETTPEDKLREATITQFQVPNTREALTEFTILATQKIRPVKPLAAIFSFEAKRQVWLNKIWIEKCEGIYTRACLAMKDDPGSLAEITRLMARAGVRTD
jgi:glucan phosphoethanolaminetransferase (alkaline phosphatase superfamily)